MFRGTTARTRFTLLAALLLALQLFAPTGTFASAHTLGQAQAKAEPEITSPAQPARDGVGSLRVPGRAGDPVGTPHLRERQRSCSAGCTPEHPLIAGRSAGADAPDTPGSAHRHAARPARAHTPAALQVFRC
ncbi:hypothetical protein [Streptomyces sp. MMG1121]|uniref:hypothetical protein n=1 Tax=Streptomyces sp. MMG1121 TaxID=1415544 RepID=UPI0006AF9251|nr:hypothetical protein [Streptomyces sp. MMG1121]KOV69257.1 hypothetical protein ADK64_06000 [Streptomyces sp. MMG1121]